MTTTHVLVPFEPTEAMIEAACVASFGPNVPKDSITALWRSGLLDIYRAMLAAAPRAPEQIAENANCLPDREKALEEALASLVAKLDECAPHIADAFVHMYLRCGDYTGLSYESELAAARALLDAKEG